MRNLTNISFSCPNVTDSEIDFLYFTNWMLNGIVQLVVCIPGYFFISLMTPVQRPLIRDSGKHCGYLSTVSETVQILLLQPVVGGARQLRPALPHQHGPQLIRDSYQFLW